MSGLLLPGARSGCRSGWILKCFLNQTMSLCTHKPKDASEGGSALKMWFCVSLEVGRLCAELANRMSSGSVRSSTNHLLNPPWTSGVLTILQWLHFNWWPVMMPQGAAVCVQAPLVRCKTSARSSLCHCPQIWVTPKHVPPGLEFRRAGANDWVWTAWWWAEKREPGRWICPKATGVVAPE